MKRLSQQAGLHEFCISPYLRPLSTLTLIGNRLAGEAETMVVRDRTAEFYVDSHVGYNRATTIIEEERVLESFVGSLQSDDDI